METLKVIAETEDPTQSDIVQEIGKSRSTISRRLKKLEEKNWISRKTAGRTKIISLTQQGYEIAQLSDEDTTPCPQQRNSGHSERTVGSVRLHKVAVAFGIHDAPITDGWEKKIIEAEDLRYRELEGENSLVYSENYTVRFTPRKAIFMVEDIVGSDAEQVADRSIERAQSHRQDIEGRLPFKLSYEPINMRVEVSEREFAIIRHPFAEAVIDNSPLKAEDIQFFPDDDDHELWIDDSNDDKELESGKGASFDEADIDLLRQDIEHKVKNPENTRRRRQLPSEVDDLEEDVDDIDGRVDNIEKATRVLLSRELRRSRERQEDNTDATIRVRREQEGGASRGRRNSPSVREGKRNSPESKESQDPESNIENIGFFEVILSKFREYSDLLSYFSDFPLSRLRSRLPDQR